MSRRRYLRMPRGEQSTAPTGVRESPPAAPPSARVARVAALQRIAGNRATQRMVSAGRVPGAVSPRRAIQRRLERGSNTGWGFFGWVDDKAEALWNRLDQKFNTDVPALKTQLAQLKTANPFLWDPNVAEQGQALDDAVTAITETLADHDGVIHHDHADELETTLNRALERGGDAKTCVTDARANRDHALGGYLTELSEVNAQGINVPGTGWSTKRRDDLREQVDALIENGKSYDPGPIASELRDITEERAAAIQLTKELRDQREREREERERQRNQPNEEEQRLLRQRAEDRAAIERVVGKLMYFTLLGKCDSNLDRLKQLVAFTKNGEGGKLSNCLSITDHAELLRILQTRTLDVDAANRMLTVLGRDNAALLRPLLAKVDDDDTLLDLLHATPSNQQGLLANLVDALGADTLDTLLAQANATRLTALFVTGNVDVTATEELLATDSANHVVAMLELVADAPLLVQLENLAASAGELFALVTDLPNEHAAVGDVRRLLTDSQKTMVDVLALPNVLKARGLKTNAGATIAEAKVSSLGGTGEQEAVTTALAGIASGKTYALTHANNAKYGEPFNNDQGRLPGVRGAGGYKEYYVEKDPNDGEYHGSRRLVVSVAKKHVYYTSDHYQSFARVR